MQTFLPFASFSESAAALDRQRLGKQRIEAKAILLSVLGEGNMKHPTVTMWQEYGHALCSYGEYMCIEWRNRGYVDNTLYFFEGMNQLHYADKIMQMPPWNFMEELHVNHRQRLIAKNPAWYQVGKGWTDGPIDFNLWPTFDGSKWTLRRAKE